MHSRVVLLITLGNIMFELEGQAIQNFRQHRWVWVDGNSSLRGFSYIITNATNERFEEQRLVQKGIQLINITVPRTEYMLRYNIDLNSTNSGQGLVMLVNNPSTGLLTFSKVFSLGKIWGHYLDLEWHIERLQIGSLVSLVLSGEGIIGLRDGAKTLQKLGSLLAVHLTAASHWLWVFIKGGRTVIETAAFNNTNAVFGHASFPLSEIISINFTKELERHRWELCQEQDALSTYCDVENPAPIRPEPLHLDNSEVLDNIPVIITGGYRIAYLYETLRTLIASPGLRKENLVVLIGDTTRSVIKLLGLMGIKYSLIPMYGEENSKLFQFYRASYQYVLDQHQSSPAAIFIDEDVEISPDFFSLMSQMIPLLILDPSIYCVTGHAGASSPSLYGKIDKVKRAASQVLWGYAVTMKFIQEALWKWPTDRVYSVIFDFWLYKYVVGNRECVYPEVSRTKHIGAGINTLGFELEKHFLPIPMVSSAGIRITNIQNIPLEHWKNYMIKEIRSATVLQGNPCEPDFFSKRPNGTYLLNYALDEDEKGKFDIESYFTIGECLNFWAMSDQGWHKGVTKIRLRPGLKLYLMGVPASPYSSFMESDTKPFDTYNVPENETKIMYMQMNKYYEIRKRAIMKRLDNNTIFLELFKKVY